MSGSAALIKDLPLGKGVSHIDVISPSDIFDAPRNEGMTVFWRGDRPVGHVLVHAGAVIQSCAEQIDAAFLAAVDAEMQAPVKSALSASVIICTRDRPAELSVCLSSLSRQSHRPHEIIVVDNASRDERTREVAMTAGAIYIREDRPGLAIARNRGAMRAAGDIVAYTDDDVLLHPRWLEQLVLAFDAPEVAAVTGLVLPAELATESQLRFEADWSFGHGYRRRDFDPERFKSCGNEVFPVWEIGAGASMAFRRGLFETLGLFDERLGAGRAGCSEDSEYWYRLLARGYACRYVATSVAFHFHRKTMVALADQIYQYMRGHAAALLVQYERTGIAANRTRAYYSAPRWYLWRLLRKAVSPRNQRDRFLKEEFMGYFAGLYFYHRVKKSTPT